MNSNDGAFDLLIVCALTNSLVYFVFLIDKTTPLEYRERIQSTSREQAVVQETITRDKNEEARKQRNTEYIAQQRSKSLKYFEHILLAGCKRQMRGVSGGVSSIESIAGVRKATSSPASLAEILVFRTLISTVDSFRNGISLA